MTEQEIRAQGATQERQRIRKIMTCPEAKGREKTAMSLALETDLTFEQAVKVLAASPKADAGFMATMTGIENPDIGPDGDTDPDTSQGIQSGWDRAFSKVEGKSDEGARIAALEGARKVFEPAG